MADIFRGIGRYLPNEYSCPSHPPPPLNPMRCIRFPEKINHLSVMRVMVGILYDGRRKERPRVHYKKSPLIPMRSSLHQTNQQVRYTRGTPQVPVPLANAIQILVRC